MNFNQQTQIYKKQLNKEPFFLFLDRNITRAFSKDLSLPNMGKIFSVQISNVGIE